MYGLNVTEKVYDPNFHKVGMTLLRAVLPKNTSFRSCSTLTYLVHVHIRNINIHMYKTSAHGCELSGFVHTQG